MQDSSLWMGDDGCMFGKSAPNSFCEATFRLAGEFIDENLGLVLGLSTMASAAAGQVVSDFSGW